MSVERRSLLTGGALLALAATAPADSVAAPRKTSRQDLNDVEVYVPGTGRGATDLRHLAAGRLDRIFAIQARYGSDQDDARQRSGDGIAYESDITTDPGYNYMSAATLKYDASNSRLTKMGDLASLKLMRHGLSIRYDDKHHEAIATYLSTHHVMVFEGAAGAVSNVLDKRTAGIRYQAGLTLLPDGRHYAVTGHWENMFVFERGTHRLVRELCLYPIFFGHSHITAA